MKNLWKFLVPILFLSSCNLQQDYHFETNGEVKMNIILDMSAFLKNMPQGSENTNFSNIKDSIKSSGIEDSLEQYGLSKFEMNFDTTKQVFTSTMAFKNISYFEKFMNKNRTENLQPISIEFTSSKFVVNNASTLISSTLLQSMSSENTNEADNSTFSGIDIDNFITFTTTYHFPYQVEKFTSEKSNGMLSENRKSIIFNNKWSDFKASEQGNFEVYFK